MQLIDILNRQFTLRAVLELLRDRSNTMENAQLLLDYDAFKLRPYENTIDVLAIGSNDDHYVCTIAGRNLSDISRLTVN